MFLVSCQIIFDNLFVSTFWQKCRDNSKDTDNYQYNVFHTILFFIYRMKIVYTRHQYLYRAVSRYRE